MTKTEQMTDLANLRLKVERIDREVNEACKRLESDSDAYRELDEACLYLGRAFWALNRAASVGRDVTYRVGDVGTHMREEEYKDLARAADTERMSDEVAAYFINRNYGFEVSQIEIVYTVEKFKPERRQGILVNVLDRAYSRAPLYHSPEWNYVRFGVRGNQYEVVNGEMHFYIN